MNLFQAQGVKDYAAAAAQIPVIDFGPCFAGEPGALERTAEVVRHACENVGFFYALNHGVADTVVDRAFAASRRFHALPLEDKLKLRLNENNIGYLPINASVQGASTVHKATRPNQNESFFISHDRGANHPDVIAGTPLRGRNQWPDGEPGLCRDMMAYFQALGAMCDRILPVFAAALDMPALLSVVVPSAPSRSRALSAREGAARRPAARCRTRAGSRAPISPAACSPSAGNSRDASPHGIVQD